MVSIFHVALRARLTEPGIRKEGLATDSYMLNVDSFWSDGRVATLVCVEGVSACPAKGLLQGSDVTIHNLSV